MEIITGLVEDSINIENLLNEWAIWFPNDNSLVEGFSSASLEALDEIGKEVANLSFGGGIEAVTFQAPEEAQDAKDSRDEIWPRNYLLDWDCSLRVTPTEELERKLDEYWKAGANLVAPIKKAVTIIVTEAIHRSLGPYKVTVEVFSDDWNSSFWWLGCTIHIGDTKKTPRLTGV